ncbi:MAG: hypothetical protein ACOX2G_11170 [Bacillota bacterium]
MSCNDLYEVRSAVIQALQELYDKDRYLIFNRPRDYDKEANHVSERSIVFRFGVYLCNICSDKGPLKFYDIDAEYNRNIYDRKNLPGYPNGTYPDLIVHKRGGNERNLLVAEFKTWWNSDRSNDVRRIKKFMAQKGNYRYRLGLSVLLNSGGVDLDWFYHSENGIANCKQVLLLGAKA